MPTPYLFSYNVIFADNTILRGTVDITLAPDPIQASLTATAAVQSFVNRVGEGRVAASMTTSAAVRPPVAVTALAE